MSEPYSDYDGYLRANLKWFLSLGLLLAAIAALAFQIGRASCRERV